MSADPRDVGERREHLPPRVADALALAEIPPSKLGAARHASLAENEREFYFWILRRFATGARPPVVEIHEIARGRGLDAEQVLETLARHDLVHLDGNGKIAVAYPFSGRPTAHRVRLDGREVYAMCAIDALGIAPMLGEPITIASRDPHTGEEIRIELEPEGHGSWRPEETVVVSGTTGSGESCDACCPVLNFFASATSAEAWLVAHPDVQGTVISIPDAIVAGRTVFGDLLEEA